MSPAPAPASFMQTEQRNTLAHSGVAGSLQHLPPAAPLTHFVQGVHVPCGRVLTSVKQFLSQVQKHEAKAAAGMAIDKSSGSQAATQLKLKVAAAAAAAAAAGSQISPHSSFPRTHMLAAYVHKQQSVKSTQASAVHSINNVKSAVSRGQKRPLSPEPLHVHSRKGRSSAPRRAAFE